MAIKAHIKAIILMTVFSMNTIIGSACASSKLFHHSHHHKSSASHDHHDGNKHDHQHSGSHHDKTDESNECCSKSSVEFNKLDKSTVQSLEVPVFESSPLALTNLYNTLTLLSRKDDRSLISHVRWRPPATIQDLRIVMQSFQI